jgi:hypothetical protein
MKKNRLKENLWQRLRLQPCAERTGGAGAIDDYWIPEEMTNEALKLWNPRTDHHAVIELSRIYCYDHDGNPRDSVVRYGILFLKETKLVLTEKEVLLEQWPFRWKWGTAHPLF